MKLCVFSDIHGNEEAFSSAYPLMLNEDVDEFLFLGDLCGYYFDQMAVFERLRRIPDLKAVRGNHDDMFLKILAGDQALADEYRASYGSSMDYLTSQAHDDLTQWLSRLPDSLELLDGHVLATHGSPLDPLTGYVYPDSSLAEYAALPAKVCLSGHSHYKMFRRDDCGRLFINPGSIGQPRGKNPPTYAVVDLDRQDVVFRAFDYDHDKLATRIDMVGDTTPYLKRVIGC